MISNAFLNAFSNAFAASLLGQNKRFAVLEQRYQQTYDEFLAWEEWMSG